MAIRQFITKKLAATAKAVRKHAKHSAVLLGVAATMSMPFAPKAEAATLPSLSPAAKITFTFDDGLTSAVTDAAPTLQKYGYSATDYVITKCVGMTTAPNTCHANTSASYMTWDQIAALHNTYGWEIGSHTETHPYLASADASDGQPNVLTPPQVTQELVNSKATLNQHGYPANNMATPYGDYTFPVLSEIAKYYDSMRGFADTGYNPFPYQDYILRDQQVQAGVSVATVKGYIDQAIANKQWLILTFHDIKPNASTNPDDYEYKTADLDAIAAYAKSKNLPGVTIEQGRAVGTNMVPNSTFDQGLSGWTIQSGDQNAFKADAAGNGNFAAGSNGPANSVAIGAAASDTYLFSPYIPVSVANTYVFKGYLNMAAIGTGSRVAVYIEEYDAAGTYLTGGNASRTAEVSVWVENLAFEFKPTNAATTQVRIGILNTANTATKAYMDNIQFFPETINGKPGDLNGDSAININDLSILLANWGKSGATGNLDSNPVINITDLSILLANWGK